ncbi:MAG: hypothetical protein WCQ95_10525 [Bacteroidota bacterium]
MKAKHIAIAVFIMLMSVSAFGQDLEHIAKQKPFHVSGGVGAGYTHMFTNDSSGVPMPSFWNVNLNLNFSIYGVSIPLSAMITNGKFDLVNSFNQFGLSPKYKWITLHAGYRQYNYSPYSVSGQTFLGGGFELRPWIIRLGFFAGRLRKAAKVDTTQYSQTIPGSYPLNVSSNGGHNYYSQAGGFTRWGWGLKIGIGKENNYVDLILFKGQDRTRSITDSFSQVSLKPEQNLVIGLNTFQKLGKHLTFGFDAAASVYTYNTNMDSIVMDEDIPLKNFFALLTPINMTSQLQTAGSVNLGLNFKNFRMATQYRRIDPYYRSMGITSTYSDVELVSTQITWSILKQKIRFSHMLQFQHDNLNHYKQLTSDRLMINATVSLNLKTKWGIDVNYNNFGMWQIKSNQLVSDSLKVYQKSNTITLIPRYIILTQNYTDVISLVASYTDINGGSVIQSSTNHVNNIYTTLNNTLVINKSGWAINSGLNYNAAKTSFNTLTSFGLIAGVSKSFFKNTLSLSNSNTVLWNVLDGKGNGNTIGIDLTAGYTLLKKHNFGCGFNYMYSPANGIYNKSDVSQLRCMVTYQYNF